METSSVKSPSSIGRRKLASQRTQLDRGNWIENAIDVLARDGVGGLRVEVLAKRCGVTKGSLRISESAWISAAETPTLAKTSR